MSIQFLREQIIAILARLEGVALVYLFGSRLTDDVGPMSDYDLGVLVDRDVDEWATRAQFAHELSSILETNRVDIVLLNRASIELAYAIITRGQVLYQRDVATRVEYEANVMSRYGDYVPVLRALRDDILKEDQYADRVHRYRAALGRTERTLGQIAAAQGQDAERV